MPTQPIRTEPEVFRPRSPTILSRCGHVLPGLLALILVVALIVLGQQTGWRLFKFSSLYGRQPATGPAWCATHSVSDSVCVECREEAMPRGKDFGWCKLHGVHECPLCHPELAQLSDGPTVSADDLRRAAASLDFAPRTENNSRCKLHLRRIQLRSFRLMIKTSMHPGYIGR